MVMPLGTLGQTCDPACIAGQICSCGGTRRSRRRTQLEKKAEKAPSVAEHAARLKEHGHAAKQRPTFDLADQESFRPSPVKHLKANQSFLIGRRLFGVPPTTCHCNPLPLPPPPPPSPPPAPPPPLACTDFTLDTAYSTCTNPAAGGMKAWGGGTHDHLTLQNGNVPLGIFDGGWISILAAKALGTVPCGFNAPSGNSHGGFSGTLLRPARIVLGCANHYGGWTTATRPTVASSPVAVNWAPVSGSYVLTGHTGTPVAYYQADLSPGAYLICCPTTWSLGATFFSQL